MALSEDLMSKCSEHMSAYKSACEEHPGLKSFDSKLQQRAMKVIDTLTAGAETGTGTEELSQHTVHVEVSKHLLEVHQEVANFILESEDDVWENKSLRYLVKAYFENTIKTLEIFDNIMESVEKAERGQLIIQEAVAQFDKDSSEKDFGGKKKRYEKTLKELKKFKAMGNPFDGRDFSAQFKLIQKQQESLLAEVAEAKKKLEEEAKKLQEEYANAQKGSLISNVVFGAVACLVFVGSVALVMTGVGAPLGVAGFVAVPAIAMGWVGVQFYLAKRMEALKRQQEAFTKLQEKLTLLEIGTETNEDSLGTVTEIAHQLEKKITSIMKDVDDAIENEGDEVDIKLDLYSIREKVEKVTEKINEVGETVAKHSKLIAEARYHILEKINGSGKYHHG
ncbi:hypothetical protein CARUB_v10017410mg [Capsella rubella]|uniref:Uncharacterized protein n=1 Tax=Capsella rubella TaxID=81985 RepID=R0FNV4_9BRAS|nr:UPF0496 protein At3g28270 [Capsella rubella]EOA24177.1 hypothetical protein CARUB_v10017410mg [Capsella rubella]